jgi:DNA-binding MarR family transcriptional regulator
MDGEEHIGLLIGAVRRRIRQAVGSRVRHYHLTTQQFWILVAIYEHPGLSLGHLAAHLRMDEPTASRVVSTLMKRDLVEIKGDAADRRRARIYMAPAGAERAKELHQLATTVRVALVKGLSPARLTALRSSLRTIVANMDHLQNGGGSGT